MKVPAWISKQLFEVALRSFFKEDKVEIISYVTKNAVADGENYTCDLFRTKLTYRLNIQSKEGHISVIIKCGNEDGGAKQDIANKLHLFEKEAEMFNKTFPAMYDILGQYYTLSSKCLYTTLAHHSIIILEDLTTLGFDVLPRHLGFNLEHCFKVIEKLAMMHAASVLMYEKDPSLVEKYNEGLYPDDPIVRSWVGAGYSALTDACSRWPGFGKYSYKLKALGGEALERGFAAQKRCFGGFNVLNHGDLWTNNMMFAYNDDGSLADMRFIDFQMNIFTSPAIDLHYFIATSTDLDVKLNNIEMLLDHYYAQLLGNLAKLHFPLDKIPTRQQFRDDYNRRAFFGLMGAATVLTFVKASTRSDASFENIIKDDSLEGFRYHAYNNKRYRKHMELLLPFYDKFGILD